VTGRVGHNHARRRTPPNRPVCRFFWPAHTGLGCEVDEAGFVTVDATGQTSASGVWAAGNVVDPRAQVITAAGAGSAAAIAINADLVQKDVEVALRRRHSELGGSSGG
jgi:NADPH-dependent glutamate synthase beta subunit-like oxidoreductase